MTSGVYVKTPEHRASLSRALRGNKNGLGKIPTLEHRRKISEAKKGKLHTMETKKKIGLASLGRTHTEEWKQKLKEQCGDKNPNWKGGITPLNAKIRNSAEYQSWRISIFARDNYTCQKTKVRGGGLHVHHILNFAQHPDLRFDLDNGITLTNKVHKKFHKKYGKTNNTREQMEEFLK